MLNYIWLALVLLAVAIGGWNDRLPEVTAGAFDGAKTAAISDTLRGHGCDHGGKDPGEAPIFSFAQRR